MGNYLVKGCFWCTDLPLAAARTQLGERKLVLWEFTEVNICLAEGDTPMPTMGSDSCPSGDTGRSWLHLFLLFFSFQFKKVVGPTLFGCLQRSGGSCTVISHSHYAEVAGP
jgi:hypothetical protein